MKSLIALTMMISFGLTMSYSAEKYQEDGVLLHNKYRLNHQVLPLTMAPNLNKVAEKCAGYYSSGKPSHSCPEAKKYGQNISRGFSSVGPPDFAWTSLQGITRWYCENKNYSYTQPDKSEGKYGHFTQLVWSDSKEVGLGCSSSKNSTHCVAIYNPAGNIEGLYKKNVFKPLQNITGETCPPPAY